MFFLSNCPCRLIVVPVYKLYTFFDYTDLFDQNGAQQRIEMKLMKQCLTFPLMHKPPVSYTIPFPHQAMFLVAPTGL